MAIAPHEIAMWIERREDKTFISQMFLEFSQYNYLSLCISLRVNVFGSGVRDITPLTHPLHYTRHCTRSDDSLLWQCIATRAICCSTTTRRENIDPSSAGGFTVLGLIWWWVMDCLVYSVHGLGIYSKKNIQFFRILFQEMFSSFFISFGWM